MPRSNICVGSSDDSPIGQNCLRMLNAHIRCLVSIMIFDSQSARLCDHEFVDGHVLARFLPVSAQLDPAKRRLGRRAVARVLRTTSVIDPVGKSKSAQQLTRPIMPASSFSKALQSRSEFLVKT